MQMNKTKKKLNIPDIGLGTWKITDRQEVYLIIENAYKCGYRLFDTAAAYMNEMAIGKALKDIRIPREELFIQDKLWNTCYGYEEAQNACKKSLRKLKLDYLDLYMIHWPATAKQYSDWHEINSETWRGLEKLYKEGIVRGIGVCNFKTHHLIELCKTAEILPSVNQLEFHPGMLQNETVSYCKEAGIQVEASSPLGNGQILKNEVLCEIARSKGVSTARICLRWGLQHGAIVIPKTTDVVRLKENFQIYNFNLSDSEMKVMDELSFCGGLGIDSDEVTSFDKL